MNSAGSFSFTDLHARAKAFGDDDADDPFSFKRAAPPQRADARMFSLPVGSGRGAAATLGGARGRVVRDGKLFAARFGGASSLSASMPAAIPGGGDGGGGGSLLPAPLSTTGGTAGARSVSHFDEMDGHPEAFAPDDGDDGRAPARGGDPQSSLPNGASIRAVEQLFRQ
eukprot:g4389.t1